VSAIVAENAMASLVGPERDGVLLEINFRGVEGTPMEIIKIRGADDLTRLPLPERVTVALATLLDSDDPLVQPEHMFFASIPQSPAVTMLGMWVAMHPGEHGDECVWRVLERMRPAGTQWPDEQHREQWVAEWIGVHTAVGTVDRPGALMRYAAAVYEALLTQLLS